MDWKRLVQLPCWVAVIWNDMLQSIQSTGNTKVQLRGRFCSGLIHP